MSASRDGSAGNTSEGPIGILAGSGTVPAEVARAILARGGRVHIVRIGPDIDGALAHLPVAEFSWGQIGRILDSFRRAGCYEIVFVGSVKRPDLTRLRPDLGFFWHGSRLLALVIAGGDDGLARTSVSFVESCGFKVASLADVAPDLLVPAGALGTVSPAPADMADVLFGSAVVRALGPHDIGQGVVVHNGVIEAIEGAEGTDRMLGRVADKRRATASPAGGVLVKRPKPGQEMRIDMPAIGPRTVDEVANAGLSGVAVLAGATLAADRPGLMRRAREAGVFVYGFTEGDGFPAAARSRSGKPGLGLDYGIERVDDHGSPFLPASWRRRLAARDVGDIRRGTAALAGLAVLGPAGAVVVVNGYVIGIEPSTDWAHLVERTRDIRPWGIGRWRARAGVLVISGSQQAPTDHLERAVDAAVVARLAAVCFVVSRGERAGSSVSRRLASVAREGIAIATVVAGADRSAEEFVHA